MMRATVATRSMMLVGCDTMLHAADIAKFPCDSEAVDWHITVARVPSVTIPQTAVTDGRWLRTVLADGREAIVAENGCLSLAFDAAFSDVTLTLKDSHRRADLYHYLYTAHTFAYHLLACGGGCIHSAGFARGGAGILLVGASGVGKSTMLDRVMQAESDITVLCEDITAVMREADRFYAYGTPFCGEDTRCDNVHAPLATIVLLRQGTQNRVHRASFAEAMFGLTQSILRPVYVPSLCETATDLAVNLARETTVLVFENDGSDEAAQVFLAALDDRI